jgi:3-phosphoshikimate 1-carboxyvinyltransferase
VAEARFEPFGPLRGEIRPPGDKSISHRAGILAAMAEGDSEIDGYLDSADTRSTLAAIRALGAHVEERPGEHGLRLTIDGVGLHGPREAAIDVGNAGTLLRILPGWLAGQEGKGWTLDGDESIRRRPVDRIAEPLRLMGTRVECRDDRLPPLRIQGAKLRAITYEMSVASAQVKSCILLAGLSAEGDTVVIEPAASRDHTERMLAVAGAEVDAAAGRITVRPAKVIEPGRLSVPGDFSSAAFLIAAALLVPSSEIRLTGVGLNQTRTGLLRILERMGASAEVSESETGSAEPVGEVIVRHAPLRGTEVVADAVPAAIDELPLVALIGCFAEGTTRVRGAAELRHKESDRIGALVEGLRGLGADIEALEDGFAVAGTGALRGGRLDSRGDHRLAMLGAVAGLASDEGVRVEGMDAVAISYPGYRDDLASLTG